MNMESRSRGHAKTTGRIGHPPGRETQQQWNECDAAATVTTPPRQPRRGKTGRNYRASDYRKFYARDALPCIWP